jgi:CRISPR-associated protein Csd2
MDMNNPIKNRYDFVLIFDVQDGNPNGDPDAGNLPRVDPETGKGLVTDVCLKRKVRNYVQITKTGEDGKAEKGFDIYIKEKAVLGRAHFKAFSELGIPTGQISQKEIPDAIQASFEELDLPDGLSIENADNEERQILVVAADADKKAIQQWIKDEKLPNELSSFIKNALKDAKPRKPTGGETEQGKAKMCEDYYDIRTFGAVMSLKSAPNCGQVRGPVQMTFARSVDPIVTLEHSITRMAVATEAEAEKQSGDNRTMGRKHTIPYGVYVAHGFVSPHLATQTKFKEDDLDILWKALTDMFEHDRSAARGLMATRKLIVFKHDTALGNAHAHELFDLVRLVPSDNANKPPRAFSDYKLDFDLSKVPAGVTADIKV